MTQDEAGSANLERFPSHIPGLDVVLGGGFFKSGVYILQGQPGCGKTIFANQICYGHVANGGRAVYVTLLTESHTRMLQHLRALSFFDEEMIPDRLSYISAYHDLEKDGLKGLMLVLNREMRARDVSVLVLDGLVAAAETALTSRELKLFIHELQTSAVFHGCTMFLVTSGSAQKPNAEHTMVDGLIELEDRLFDARAERSIWVKKFRGAESLRGKHAFQITNNGLTIFPRVEALFTKPTLIDDEQASFSTGVAEFDRLISLSGLPANSATVVVGSTGTGKTTLALHFLAGSTAREPGLFFGFFESPDRLRMRARCFGIDLQGAEASGAIEIMWQAMGEHVLDELAHRLLNAVSARGVKRLVIDGLSGFFEAATYPERIGRFFACLTNELRRRGVTMLMTLETRDVVGSVVPTPYGVSALVDNLIFLRFAESQARLERLISILKMRCSDYDPAVYSVKISSTGITLGPQYASTQDAVIPSAEPL